MQIETPADVENLPLEVCEASDWLKEQLIRSLKTDTPISFRQFMARIFRMSPKSSNTEDGEWDMISWQIGIMCLIADLDIPRIGVQKPTQRGISMILLGFALYEVCFRNRSTGIFQPRKADAEAFSIKHLAEAIKNIPEVAEKLLANPHASGSDNRIDYKGFVGGGIGVHASQRDNDLRSDSYSSVLLDEGDGMPRQVQKGEGNEKGSSPIALSWGRMDAEDWKKQVVVSTVRVKGQSNTEEYIAECAEVFKWHLPCPECNAHQQTVWGGPSATAEFGVIWDEVLDEDSGLDEYASCRTARYRCQFCKHEFTYTQMQQQNKLGYWQSEHCRIDHVSEPYRILDVSTLEPVAEKPRSAGIVFPGFFSGNRTALQDGVEEYLVAKRFEKGGSSEKIIRWRNEYAAETVDATVGAMRIEGASILTLREDYLKLYGGKIPAQCQYLTAFWDLNRERGSMGMVCGFGAGFETWLLEYYHLEGSPLSSGHDEQIHQLMRQQRTRADGSRCAITVCLIDSGWMPELAQSISDRNPNFYITTKGRSKGKKPIFEWSNGDMRKRKAKTLGMIGTDTAKTYFYERLLQNRDIPQGRIHIPSTAEFDLTTCSGLVAEELVHIWRDGKNPDEEWRRVSAAIWNEPLDCATGCIAGMHYVEDELGIKLLDQEPLVEAQQTYKRPTPLAGALSNAETLRSKYVPPGEQAVPPPVIAQAQAKKRGYSAADLRNRHR